MNNSNRKLFSALSTRHSALFFCLVFFLLLLQSGCAPRPVGVERPARISDAELLAGLQSRTEYWRQFQAKLHISAQSRTKGKLRRIQTLALAALPDRFRLEALNPLGQAVGAMVSTPGSSSLWVPSENVAYQAESAETLIEHLIGVPIALDTLLYSLAACVPPPQLQNLEIRYDTSGLVAIYNDSARNWRFTWQFTSQPLALRSLTVAEGAWSYEIRYDPPVGLDAPSSARKITYASPDWRMEVTVDQISKSPELESSIFHLPLPSGIRTVKPGDAKWKQQNP